MIRRFLNLSLDLRIQLVLVVFSILYLVIVHYFGLIVTIFDNLPLEPTKSILRLLEAVYPTLLAYQLMQLLFMVFVQNSKAHQGIFFGLVMVAGVLFLRTNGFKAFFGTSGLFNVSVLVGCSTAYVLFNGYQQQQQQRSSAPDDALLDDDLDV